ncbi:AsmA-like C-terminal region-containing protein [Cognatishimia sp. WU-CL00825]|uniref:AsmA-like C-terminal region-containing protein n=1 Tax=Cognatishimia sp. WU-CL00825 TaxID=3127658 RepID=UPI003365AEE0
MVGEAAEQETSDFGQTHPPMTNPNPKPKLKRRYKAVLWSFGLLTFIAISLAAGGYYAIGRTIHAPQWVKDLAITQFSKALPEATLSFDNLTILIEKNWHPQIRLERVVIAPNNSDTSIAFSEVETSLSYRRLLKRQVAPREIFVTGVFLKARRALDGTVNIAVQGQGVSESASDEGTSIDQVVKQIDDWLSLPQFERLTSVQVDGITIQFDDLRADRAWTIDGGHMALERAGDQLRLSSSFSLLGGRDYVSSLEFNYQSQIGSLAAQFGVNVEDVAAEDIASQSPGLAWLDILRAPISGAMRVAISETGTLGPLNATLQIAEGVLQPRDTVRPIPFESARSYFTYIPETNTLRFDELSLVSAWGTARAEGKAHLLNSDNGLPDAMLAQFQFTEVKGNPAELFDAPIELDKIQGDFRLNLDPFKLDIGELFIQDQGQALVIDGVLSATEDDWDVALNGHMNGLDARRVVEWWPERAKPKTRKWVDENIHAGKLSDINLALRSRPGAKPDVYLDFEFSEANVRYVKTLPNVEGGKGQFVWVKDRLVVQAVEGFVRPELGGPLDIAGTAFVIPDTRIKKPPAEVYLESQSTITAALSLLDYPPFNYLTKADLPVDFADGVAQVSAGIKLALVKNLKPNDVDFQAQALLSEVVTDHFVPGKEIASESLVVQASNTDISVGGKGKVGAVPFEATWSSALGQTQDVKSSVRGEIEIGERFIQEFKVGLPSDLVTGRSVGVFEIDLIRGMPPRFAVTSDTVGLALAVPPLGWKKAADQSGQLQIEGTMGKPVSLDSIVLSAPGLTAKGAVSVGEKGGLKLARFDKVKLGSWFEGSVDLVGRGAGRNAEVRLQGGHLKLADMPTGRASGGSLSGPGDTPILAKLNRLTISDGIDLTNFDGAFSTTGGFNGKFSARVNGDAVVTGVVVPQAGRNAVRIQSGDAGGVFRAAGVLRQVYGGALDLTLRPVSADGQYDGRLLVKDVRVKDAPAMAELLNAVSVVGLLEQLGGEGIAFNDVEALFRLSPSGITLTEGSAVGTSMGLSMDGVYSFANKALDMQGVISPVYLLNVVGRPVARKGEGLFGFNYRLGGTSDAPKVSVNPLSVLTPGILRDIFRRPRQTPNDSVPK